LFAQYRVPMHRLYAMLFVPSGPCTVAFTGHTTSHGAFSQCTHATGWAIISRGLFRSSPVKYRSTRIHVISRPLATSVLPTIGMLFSLWHATVHTPQPVQLAGRSSCPTAGPCCSATREPGPPGRSLNGFSYARRCRACGSSRPAARRGSAPSPTRRSCRSCPSLWACPSRACRTTACRAPGRSLVRPSSAPVVLRARDRPWSRSCASVAPEATDPSAASRSG
jgi:hypothetical protein